jgi:hypothetical protein
MSNSLNIDLTGKTVVVRAEAFRAEYNHLSERLFAVDGGFGAAPYTSGTAVFGTYLKDGQRARIDGNDVERLATDDDLAVLKP